MAERDKEKSKHALELYIQLIPTLNTGLCEHNPQAGSEIEQSIYLPVCERLVPPQKLLLYGKSFKLTGYHRRILHHGNRLVLQFLHIAV